MVPQTSQEPPSTLTSYRAWAVSSLLDMVYLTPGLRFLFNGALYGSVPVIGGLAVKHLLARTYGAGIPTWGVVVGSLAFFPIRAVIRLLLKEWTDSRAAAAMGAQVVPRVRGKLFGNFDIVQKMKEARETGYPGDVLDDMFDLHGSMFNIYIMHADVLFTISPEHIKLILVTDFSNFVKGERLQETGKPLFGSGILNSDGEMWKFHRSISRPAFTRERISDFEIFDRHAATAISQIKQRLRQGYAVDFENLMARFTLDTTTEFLFGSCTHSLSVELPYPYNAAPPSAFTSSNRVVTENAFAKALGEAQNVLAYRDRSGWIWPLEEIFHDKIREPMQTLDEYIKPIIKEALARKGARTFDKNDTSEHLGEGETLLDRLVRATEDPNILKDETINILIAGRDSSSATLTFMVYLLSIHPHAMTRLRQEILETVGSTRMPNQNDIKKMKYLKAVINETLRLFPPVPFNFRESINATIWPNPDPTQKPYYIPAKARVVYSVFMMQRRTDLWGPDALAFNPDRFLDDHVNQTLTKNPCMFLPFNNAGPRTCLGQQFACSEISFMIIRLLQSFSSIALDTASAPPDSLPPPTWKKLGGRKAIERIVPKVHLTMYSGGGLWIKMEEAPAGPSHD